MRRRACNAGVRVMIVYPFQVGNASETERVTKAGGVTFGKCV